MAWLYDRKSGCVGRTDDPENNAVAVGYSGHGIGKNNPDMSNVHDVGPIPRGMWSIVALLLTTADHGPFVLRLAPKEGTETFGRTGFLIHGDSVTNPGGASLGCIILPRTTREMIWRSNDKELIVT
jgi:hypothetical protein